MICNRDCFNCIHPDCINDDLSYHDMKEQDKADKEISYELPDGDKKKTRIQRGYDRKYYLANKETILQKQRQNKNLRSQYNRTYYQNNIEKERQRSKEKHLRNRDKRLEQLREYNRLYYQRKKVERQVG